MSIPTILLSNYLIKFLGPSLNKSCPSIIPIKGHPAKPIRMMVGLLLLKQLYNLGDETVIEDWKKDLYFQYFTGEAKFQWKQPCDPSDLVHFRKRIGEEGIKLLLGRTTHLHKILVPDSAS